MYLKYSSMHDTTKEKVMPEVNNQHFLGVNYRAIKK